MPYGMWLVSTILCFSTRYLFNTCADDTIARKVNTSDASQFAKICGCFPSQGIVQYPVGEVELMTVNSVGRHLAYRGYYLFCAWNYRRTSGIQGLTLFLSCKFEAECSRFSQESAQQQKTDSTHFLPVPGSTSNGMALGCPGWLSICLTYMLSVIILEIW